MQESPAQTWTVGALAGQTRVSRATLARRFAGVVGQPPMEFLTQWRLTLAADLILDPAGNRRLRRPHGGLQLSVRAERRLQARPRHQPHQHRTAQRRAASAGYAGTPRVS